MAAPDELVALASVLAEFGFGSIEFIPKTFLEGYSAEDRALILQLWRASGKPVHLNTLTRLPQAPDGWKRSLDFASEAFATEGARIHPMFASNHQGVHFALASTFLFDEYLTLRSTLTSPPAIRDATMRSPKFRAALRVELADVGDKSFTFSPHVLRVEIVHKPEHERYVGMTISEMAGDMGCDALDAFLDVSLAEGLQTQFVQAAPPDQGRLDTIEELIRGEPCSHRFLCRVLAWGCRTAWCATLPVRSAADNNSRMPAAPGPGRRSARLRPESTTTSARAAAPRVPP